MRPLRYAFNQTLKIRRCLRVLYSGRKLQQDFGQSFFHFTPDISGGVATWLLMFARAFPDYGHFVACTRGTNGRPALRLQQQPNTYLVSHVSHEEAVFMGRWLPSPVALFNHLFWDLKPITKEDYKRPEVPIVAFFRGHDARLNCDPQVIDKLVVFNRFFQENYQYEWPDDVAPIVLGHGIDTAQFVHVKPLRPQNGKFIIGNITNGAPWKHSDDFVNLCLSIGEAIPVAQFAFLGAKDLRAKVKNLEDFHILAPYSIETPAYLQKVSVVIHKTHADVKEAWSNAIGEVMAAGVPVVAEGEGGIQDQIVHGKTGFLCRDNDDFVHYCQLLYQDEDLYQQISSQAKLHAEKHFSLKAYRKRIEEHLLSG